MSNREAAAASERPLPPLPEPRAWMMEWPQHSPSFTCDKSDYVSWHFGKASYPDGLKDLFTAEQMHAYVLADRAASAPQAVAAQPAALGVDAALWTLAEVSFAAGIAHGQGAKNDWSTDGKVLAIIEALRADLSTALTGAAKKENDRG